MAINSKQKGKQGELELSHKLKEYGYDCRRSQQYCGVAGDSDVIGLKGVHIECKRVEKLNIYEAVERAKSDAKKGDMPAVFHRKNRKEWLVTVTLDDFIELYKNMEAE